MTGRRTLPNGRSGEAKPDRFAHNAPPTDQPWFWFTKEMLESPAWAAMSLAARKVVERLLIEHMDHAGTMNGELVVTYADFESFGVRRKSIKPAIEEAINLGWIDRTVKGSRNHGAGGRPSHYALTWLGRRDRTPPSNRWKTVTPGQNIYSRGANAPWRKGRNPSRQVAKTPLNGGENAPCLRGATATGENNFEAASESGR